MRQCASLIIIVPARSMAIGPRSEHVADYESLDFVQGLDICPGGLGVLDSNT